MEKLDNLPNPEEFNKDGSLFYWMGFWLSAGVTGLLFELVRNLI